MSEASEWKEWTAGDRKQGIPPFSDHVDVKLRNGEQGNAIPVTCIEWGLDNDSGEVIAWRPAVGGVLAWYDPQGNRYTEHDTHYDNDKAQLEKLGSAVMKDTNPKDAVGVKKVPFSTVSLAVLVWAGISPLSPVVAEVGLAMLEGGRKYGRHNYREVGVRASVYYDAAMRHMCALVNGQALDPDSGLSHKTKAVASLVVLCDAWMNGKLTDDRPPRLSAIGHEHLEVESNEPIENAAFWLASWWEGGSELLLASVIELLCESREKEIKAEGDFMQEMNRKAGEIIAKYPDAKAPYTEVEHGAKC